MEFASQRRSYFDRRRFIFADSAIDHDAGVALNPS
jgi:hypothetical protein